jgi:plastocyanin
MGDMPGMTSSTNGSTAASGNVQCAQHMPGDLLSASEAMVVFDPEHVCLGYVTVRPGTAITWHNVDSVEHQVRIEDGNGTELMSFSVPGGGAAQRSVDTGGVYRFKVSAIESFVGTIEVDA